MTNVLTQKALEAQICYEDLLKRLEIETNTPVIFNVDDTLQKRLTKACFEKNPFPGVLKPVLLKLRLQAVSRLFTTENVLQTGPAASILALDSILSKEFGDLRNGVTKRDPVICDVGLSGLQVIRLYMMAYDDKVFRKSRYDSAIRVDNALNGSFYKYKTKDNRYFSAHVYYESQKEKMMKVLGITKKPSDFSFLSLPFDKKTTAEKIAQWNSEELEEAAFDAGACGCKLRTRKEWEETEVGKAVCNMPLYRFEKMNDAPKKDFGKPTGNGPLSGIKVLDLTHIIAGPACTRLLAEQGADVLMIRRGDYMHQEQAMLELDGWAGKNSIQLDFNIPEQLERAKQLVKESDVVICSYQNGALNHFGLSEEDIFCLNPNVIYGSLVCFSDTVWKTRPGWAPCAEDITGLSVRNGSYENPVNLNGVPLDYIPGFILCSGILKALKLQMIEGGSYKVTGSLTRGGYWLHECTDLMSKDIPATHSKIEHNIKTPFWNDIYHKVESTSVGTVYFPPCATYSPAQHQVEHNMPFHDGQTKF